MTPEEEAAYAARFYTCPTHAECLGPNGVFVQFPCSACGEPTYWETCWQKAQRVPATTPVLCADCSSQGALF